jgi:hypothetical protein
MMRTLTGTRDLPQWIKQVEADTCPDYDRSPPASNVTSPRSPRD